MSPSQIEIDLNFSLGRAEKLDMKSRHFFLITCLSIVCGLLWSYSVFLKYFGEHGEDQIRVTSYARQIREERFARDLAEARLRDLGQEVASVLPSDKAAKLARQGYALDNLAMAVREPASIPLELSGVRLERAKRLFNEKDYKGAASEFEKITRDYPTSPKAIEAYFLLTESAYLQKDEKKVVEVADLLVSQYPDHELTGFALLRLGQINESNHREEEASEIYRAVMRNFHNPQLVEQAKRMSQALAAQ